MLVLTRKLQESIMIGDDIEVSVLSIQDHKVKIGVRAPRRVSVYRTEIYAPVHPAHAVADASARAEVDAALARLSGVSARVRDP